MKKRKLFLKPRRISYGIPVLLILIFIVGVITRKNIDRYKDDWKLLLPEKEQVLRKEVTASFNERAALLEKDADSLITRMEKVFASSGFSDEQLLKIAAGVKGEVSFLVTDPKNRLYLSSENAPVLAEYLKIPDKKTGYLNFITTPVGTFLVLGKALNDAGRGLYFFAVIPFEIRNLFTAVPEYSFTSRLEQKNDISIALQYFPNTPDSSDGREFTIPLKWKGERTLGWATVQYPSWRGEAQNYSAVMSTIQSVLIFLCALVLLLSIRPDYKRIRRPWIKPLVVVAVLSGMRYLLFLLNLPGSTFTGELSNASFFASKLGGGIVRSPIEFIITVIFLLGFSVYFLRFARKEISHTEVFNKPVIQIAAQTALVFLLYWFLRGCAASVKSIVFDSTLRYFKGTDIIPDLPNLIMHSGALLFGISFFFLATALVILSVKILGSRNKLITFVYVTLFHGFGLLFYLYVQPTPLFPVPAVLTASASFVLLHIIVLQGFAGKKVLLFVLPLLASGLTILSFNVFNIELEREALKTEALELSRPDESLFRFNLTETLTDPAALELTKNIIRKTGRKFNDLAFMIWNKSSLRSSLYMSGVLILDEKRKVIGKFFSADEKAGPTLDYIKALTIPSFFITRVNEKKLEKSDAFIAINPVMDEKGICGYVMGVLVYTPFVKPAFTIPSAIYSEPVNRTSILDEQQTSVFVFKDSLLAGSRGPIELTRELQASLLNGLGTKNEAWLTVIAGDELLYYVSREATGKRIFAVGSMTKNLDWRLYNVVRILFIHLLLLASFLILYGLTIVPSYFGRFPRRVSFRFQLLAALLITSIVPLIAVAQYNRETVTRKNNIIIQNTLRDRASVIERALINEKSPETALPKLSGAGIPFTLYKNETLLYSTEEGRKNGFLPERPAASVALQIKEMGTSEVITEAEIAGGLFKQYFKKFRAGNENYMIALNTLFNPVEASYSPEEIDVFIIGIYTVASLVMVFLGFVFVNRISRPLRTLTAAAEKISHGDYDISLGKPRYSEIGELMTTFEKMSVELKKAQETTAGFEREKAWKDFARQVAHEIKNPLTPMKLTLQQLLISFKEKPDYFNERFEGYANMLMEQIEILNKIASEFSSFARMPSVSLSSVNLRVVAAEVVLLYKEDAVQVQLQGAEGDCYILSDAGYMKRSLINLIRNAIQAEATEIEINIQKSEGSVILTVSDNGIGISPEIAGQLFVKSFTTKKTGMGLGLSLTREFIEACGGTITPEESEKGKTVFKISLPLQTENSGLKESEQNSDNTITH